MDSVFYVIIVLLIVLKVLIWVCVYYARAQRLRTARCQRGFIVVQDTRASGLPQDRDRIVANEQLPGYMAGGVDNVVVQMPPSYEEVVRTAPPETKPPSYEQATTVPPQQPSESSS